MASPKLEPARSRCWMSARTFLSSLAELSSATIDSESRIGMPARMKLAAWREKFMTSSALTVRPRKNSFWYHFSSAPAAGRSDFFAFAFFEPFGPFAGSGGGGGGASGGVMVPVTVTSFRVLGDEHVAQRLVDRRHVVGDEV